MSNDMQKELAEVIAIAALTLLVVLVCLLFNYFIVKQQNEAEILRKKRVMEEASRLLFDDPDQM